MAQFKTHFRNGMHVVMKNNTIVMEIVGRTDEDGIYNVKAAYMDGSVVQVHEDEIAHPSDQRITHHFKVGERYFQAIWDEAPNTWELARLMDDGELITVGTALSDLADAKAAALAFA
jgi:hypothetical protein